MSLILRPFLERDRARLWLGAPMMAAFVAIGTVSQPGDLSLPLEQPIIDQNVLLVDVVMPGLSNEVGYLLPVEDMYAISQSYHPGHPGIDITTYLYAPITVVDGGRVADVVYSGIGYGNHVYVDHEEGVRTLYAHMHRIYVAPGQTLTAGTIIGTVGMSGWTTGPHLHFEVNYNGQQFDPMQLIARAMELSGY